MNKCFIVRCKPMYCVTKEGTYCSDIIVYNITIKKINFFLTPEEYLLYKLQGYFDKYDVLERNELII